MKELEMQMKMRKMLAPEAVVIETGRRAWPDVIVAWPDRAAFVELKRDTRKYGQTCRQSGMGALLELRGFTVFIYEARLETVPEFVRRLKTWRMNRESND